MACDVISLFYTYYTHSFRNKLFSHKYQVSGIQSLAKQPFIISYSFYKQRYENERCLKNQERIQINKIKMNCQNVPIRMYRYGSFPNDYTKLNCYLFVVFVIGRKMIVFKK